MLTLLCVAGAALALGDDPPPPDLKNPVNYVAWLNEQYDVGDKPNAALAYQRAIDVFVDDEETAKICVGKESHWRPLRPAEKDRVQAWIDRNEKCLKLFAEASEIRACFFSLAGDEMLEVQLPLKQIRHIGKLVAGRARVRLSNGNVDGAVEDVASLLRCGAHLRKQPLLISYLVGIAVGAQAYAALREIPLHELPEVDYAGICKILRRADRSIAAPRDALRGETLFVLDILQRNCTDADGDGRIEQCKLDDQTFPILPPASLSTLTAGLYEQEKQWRRVFGSDFDTARRLAADAEPQANEQTFFAVVSPSLTRVDLLRRAYQRDRRCTRIVLRMHAVRQSAGGWPLDLKEATQGESNSIRRDPFSEGEFVYKLVKGQPLLYSLGDDGDDDQGAKRAERLDDDGDYVYWPPKE